MLGSTIHDIRMQSAQEWGFVGGYQVGPEQEKQGRTIGDWSSSESNGLNEKRTCGQTLQVLFRKLMEKMCKVRKTDISSRLGTSYSGVSEFPSNDMEELEPCRV